jgi:hypothetical protein
MTFPSITPVAKSVYLCDGHIGLPGKKTDLMGLFNRIRPHAFPHRGKPFVVFAQLKNGLGQVPFFVEIRLASTGQLIFASNVHQLHFPDRLKVVQMAYTVRNCVFPDPGIYLVELLCNNQWVADTSVELGIVAGSPNGSH